MNINIQSLQQAYLDWATQKQTFETQANFTTIRTPFVDMYHDTIELFIEHQAGQYILSDDGYTLDELDTLDLQLSSGRASKKRQAYFNQICLNFGIQVHQKELQIRFTDLAAMPQKQFQLVQGMLQIMDMLQTSRDRVSDYFLEDIRNYFFEKELSFVEDVSFQGQTGNMINFNYIFGKKSINDKAKAIKAVNRPKSIAYESPLMGIIDVRDSRPDTDFYVLANDTESISDKFISSFENYSIPVLQWSKRDNWIKTFKLS
ncbi:DUF1828 domain-containing protein [Lactiplantibacillus dongliensis]|uniref:DUF1828 domain-containing protein n=1 Tax=Lactiplantibacillus dongliensis TaxID=2559919 RepID=A0ABW1R6R7_9LACO|nr:DUF1828 domain-containing protein [Lactiplantibacillus dongliensis]